MASIGIHTNGSQFYIGLADGDSNRHMNGRCVAFGRVVKGTKILDEISNTFTQRLRPAREIKIEDCGVL
jgi:cyclophilin family peptidyl-prolyl cis-trans isomerase